MGGPFEDAAYFVGLGLNCAVFSAVLTPILDRAFDWPSSPTLALSFVMAFLWMLLCDRLYQKRKARKGARDAVFLALVHCAPTAVVFLCALGGLLWTVTR